jgi:hypothetical protein
MTDRNFLLVGAVEELPPSGNFGDAYIVRRVTPSMREWGELFLWTDGAWVASGELQGSTVRRVLALLAEEPYGLRGALSGV